MENKQKAEAYVGGVLRGGHLIGDLFCYHAGTVYVETRDYRELKIFDESETGSLLQEQANA